MLLFGIIYLFLFLSYLLLKNPKCESDGAEMWEIKFSSVEFWKCWRASSQLEISQYFVRQSSVFHPGLVFITYLQFLFSSNNCQAEKLLKGFAQHDNTCWKSFKSHFPVCQIWPWKSCHLSPHSLLVHTPPISQKLKSQTWRCGCSPTNLSVSVTNQQHEIISFSQGNQQVLTPTNY